MQEFSRRMKNYSGHIDGRIRDEQTKGRNNMAISIKEITNKQFSFQESNGYNCDEVDDFLDALAAQMTELVRENSPSFLGL